MRRPRIMGVLNVTPDSFSDGGRFSSSSAAVEAGLRLLGDGADILDIGGESTRPGADAVSTDEELSRVLPVIEGLRRRVDAPLSVDTMKPEVAAAAVSVGATMWNDVAGLGAAGALGVAAKLGVDVVIMHMRGVPQTMQSAPSYDDVLSEVTAFLHERAEAAVTAGLARERIWVDPGIGFGKTLAHNLALIRGVGELAQRTGFPVLFGASRKRFIQAIDPTAAQAIDRLGGSIAAALWAAQAGAAIVRVHDVRATRQALEVQSALSEAP